MATLVGLLALAASMVPASASTASPALGHIGGSATLWAEWTSTEQQDFEAVLSPFEAETGVNVIYSGKGSSMDTAIDAAVAGGAPPAVALVPDPGTVLALAAKGAIKPLASVIGSEASDYGAAWNNLVTYKGKLYGVWFKGANKNTIWYNPAEFAAAGLKSTPTTWQGLLADAATLKRAGVTPFSLCTDIGWPVADLWQNVYLKTAGAADYDSLAAHNIAWTGPTVTTAFDTLAQLVGQPSYLLGGTKGALANSYPECVDKVFPKAGTMPQAAMVIEADFVVSEIVGNSANYTAGTTGAGGKKCTANPAATPCYDFFPFPAPAADQKNNSAIQGSGDVAMLLKSSAASKALVKYLGSPEAGEIWAHLGGFAQQVGAPEQLPGPRHKGGRVRAAESDELRLQLGRPAGQLGAEPVARHAQLRQEPQHEQHRLDRKDDAGSGHSSVGPLGIAARMNQPGHARTTRACPGPS
jgi:hypothetical protein